MTTPAYTLKARLEKHYAINGYLPGSLEYLITQSWATESTLKEEVIKCIVRLELCDDRTPREDAFFNSFYSVA